MNTPKKISAVACLICLTLHSPLRAELDAYTPISANQTESPIFPRQLATVGTTSGTASIAVAVDEDGKMTDYLVTSYSNPAFAESALYAVKKWTFEPMRVHGSPMNSETDLTFHFAVDGVVVVSVDALDSSELIRSRMAPGSDSFRAYTPGQIGLVPRATKVVNPSYTLDQAHSSNGGRILVDFYIDETGHVRMPSVSRETNEANGALAALAISTLSQWEFEPAVYAGRPVLVRAQQLFLFKPAHAPSTSS
jgi:TonB family protein